MATPTPIMAFLRPLGPPRTSTVRQFLQFSSSAQCRAAAAAAAAATAAQPQEDANLVASRTASSSYPPPSMKSLPRPKESRASRRTAHPTKERPYPTRRPSHHQPAQQKLIPEPVEFLSPELSAPNLPYFVSRTPSNELPIYTDRKRGGNLKLTLIRKVDGQKEVLRDELRELLGLAKEEAVLNGTTGHIVLKGHYKPAVQKYLRERRF